MPMVWELKSEDLPKTGNGGTEGRVIPISPFDLRFLYKLYTNASCLR